MVRNMYNSDFFDSGLDDREPSIEDKKWKVKMEESIRTNENGYYEIPLLSARVKFVFRSIELKPC